ncbi:MAG: transglutaminase domain-containing protein [Elusimicrobia bacterium]|nr:transglutaminase domain-containing protein [Elusimicrobiota bacterium]
MGKRDRNERTDDRAGRVKLLLAMLPAAALCVCAPLTSIQLLHLENGRIGMTSVAVQEDPWVHPRLLRLRRDEKLDEVVAPGKTQLEKIVLLRRWARRQWDAGPQPFYYPAWDALEILDLARRRGNKAFCAQYAVLFLQSARSLGLHARYLDMGHFLTSVWSDEHDRWVVMDPTNDLHYEKRGVPMGDWELIRAAWRGRAAGIEVVGPGEARKPITSAELAPFRVLAVCQLNDQLSNPAVVIHNGRKRALTLESDYRRYPLVGKERVGYGNYCLGWHEAGKPAAEANWPVSSEPDDFAQANNQTVLFVAEANEEQGVVKLRLMTETAPEFAAFVGGPEGQAAGELTSHVVWSLKPGINAFTARVKTAAGWLGPESRVKVFYKPSWLGSFSYRLASLR